jgi:hypothetical protein
MARFKRQALERSAVADLFKHTLSKIPTRYGRLVYLASLRDQNSGIYRHHGLSTAFGREESMRALEESHEQVFREWLGLPLPEKHSDLGEYLSSLEDPVETAVQYWLKSGIHRSWPPPGATEPEKDFFYQDLEVLLKTAGFRSPPS